MSNIIPLRKLRVIVGGSTPKTESEKYHDAHLKQRIEAAVEIAVDKCIAAMSPKERADSRERFRMHRKAETYIAEYRKAKGLPPLECYF